MANGSVAALECKAGKHLAFRLAREEYGVEILKVQEIIGMMNVTRVPRTPEFIRGVVNLRGKVIPVIDLRIKFGLPVGEDTEKMCIIVVRIQEEASRPLVMGMIVDEVLEVIDVTEGQLEATPDFGGGVATEFITGMAKVGNRVLTMLAIARVLSNEEVSTAAVMAQPE